MKKLFLFSYENAVVGVVTAVLIIGLIVAVVSLVQTVYVPKMMEQREAEHMDEVADQFAWLKSSIDNQVAMQQKHVPVVSSITLGSKELPYLLSVRAFGSIQIVEDAVTICFYNYNDELISEFNLGTLRYDSINAYYLDQSFVYESGGVVVSQADGDMMYVRPSFFMVDADNVLNMSTTLVNISAVGEKYSATGFGVFPIQTEFYNNVSFNYSDIYSMNVSTRFPNAWSVYAQSSLDPLKDFLRYSIIENDKGFKIYFKDYRGYPQAVNFRVDYVDIFAQVGPGWIE